jgi:hypothetical protein
LGGSRVRFIVLTLLAATLAGCAGSPYAGYLPIPAAELAPMVAGRSLLLGETADWPYQTVLYLAPDGGGWRDGRLAHGTEPRPGDMAMVLGWRVTDEDGLCVWSTPLIGDMPSGAPPLRDCLRVLRAPTNPAVLAATATDAERSITAALQLRDGSVFPLDRIAQYQLQVRVLYGGRLNNWSIP